MLPLFLVNFTCNLMEKVCNHSPSGNTCRIFRYEVVSRMIEALSNCDVMALGSGRSFASSRNSAFSFSRRDRAAFLLFSFMAQRADKPKCEENKWKWEKVYEAILEICSRRTDLFEWVKEKSLGNDSDRFFHWTQIHEMKKYKTES